MTLGLLMQMIVVVVGTAWCLALASILFFGGWYARTHPDTGTDRVIQRLVGWLRFLTFGLTAAASSDREKEACGGAKSGQEASVRSTHQHAQLPSGQLD